MEKVEYKGWSNCVRLSNDLVDLIATTDVGPRIIRFGFVGGENEFKEYEDMMGQTGGDEWRTYGGHRLWHAPEVQPRTYFPDNAPISERHLLQQASGYVEMFNQIFYVYQSVFHFATFAPACFSAASSI